MNHLNKESSNGQFHIQKIQHSNQEKSKSEYSEQKNQHISSPQAQQQFEKNEGQQADLQAQNLERQQRQIDGVTIFCRICQDFIAHSVTTTCQHTFCQLCLVQYMIYIDQCPECGCKIRHQRLSNNILLDNLIRDYIKKYQSEDVQAFEEKLERYKAFQRQKKLNQFEAGMKVDVRDSDYVWCTGRIYRTVNKFQQKKVKCMIVKYDKSNKKQEFPQNSPRIAPLGFFTNRKDIPRYQRGKLVLQDQQQNIMYTIPSYCDDKEQNQEEEKENQKKNA